MAVSVGGDSVSETRPQVGARAVPATPSPTTSRTRAQAAPRLVKDHLRFTAQRKADTAAYAKRHYGVSTATLTPRLIVLHVTESDTYASVRSLFDANQPNRGEAPGTCAHYVVDQDGTVYELVPPNLVCRHTIGLNHVAIGIEFVQASHGHDARWAVQQVLRRRAQVDAGAGLVRMLQQRYGIADAAVIGHAMANDTKGFRDLEDWRNDHTDWQPPEVVRFRSVLDATG